MTHQEASQRLEDEVRRSNHAFQQREQLALALEGLVESLADGVVALDFRGEITHISDSLREPSAAHPGAFDFQSAGGAEEILPRGILERLRREIPNIDPRRPSRFQIEWRREELGPRVYQVVGVSAGTTGGSGSLLTLFGFQDQTRITELEAALSRSQDLAALGQMAATVAHELRNPLGAIQGFATLLQKDLASNSQATRQIERILLGVQGANQIIEDLLEYSRPIDLKMEPISIESLIAESIAVLSCSRYSSPDIDLDLRLDPGLPPCRGDRRHLLQILGNLYHNAIDAMDGKGQLVVRARTTEERNRGEMIRLVIRDTGCGLTSEEVARVFEPFYTSKPGGTGLGLAIVRRTLEALGGRIHLVSAPGRGTSLVVDIPTAFAQGRVREVGAAAETFAEISQDAPADIKEEAA